MQFLAPTNIFEGVVQLNQTPSADNHAVTKAYLEANSVVGISAESANYAEVVVVNGKKELKIKPLTITDVSVDTQAADLAGWVSANYTNGNEKQEGDIIILTGVQGRAQTWIHTGGTAGDVNDFAPIEGADVGAAEVRTYLSASNGVAYNSATGEFTAVASEIRGFFGAGSGLSYDSANGVFSLNVDTDGINEGSTNKFYSDTLVDAHLSGDGSTIAYNAGVISFVGTTDNITEGSAKFYSDSLVDSHLSGDGSTISYNAGVISFVGTTDDITEGNAKFYSTAAVHSDIGVSQVFGPEVQLLTYDNAGKFGVKKSDIFLQFSAGTGLAFNGGQYSFTGTTDIVQEGTTNRYFSDTRARSAVNADPSNNNLLQYNSSTGEMLVSITKFRKEFAPHNLTANTWSTLAHNLGKRQVHVSAYDVGGNLIQLDVQLVDNNQLKIKSVVNVTNAEVVVSI